MRMLDPFDGPEEIEPLSGLALVELVAFYKRTADQNGEPYDPEWDRWIEEDPDALAIRERVRNGRR